MKSPSWGESYQISSRFPEDVTSGCEQVAYTTDESVPVPVVCNSSSSCCLSWREIYEEYVKRGVCCTSLIRCDERLSAKTLCLRNWVGTTDRVRCFIGSFFFHPVLVQDSYVVTRILWLLGHTTSRQTPCLLNRKGITSHGRYECVQFIIRYHLYCSNSGSSRTPFSPHHSQIPNPLILSNRCFEPKRGFSNIRKYWYWLKLQYSFSHPNITFLYKLGWL